MGIVNVTPDSFSADQRTPTLESALARAETLLAQGATLLDIGGESTRPNATPVDCEEECARVIPVIEALHARHPEAILSVDTRHTAVARAALEAGAVILNNVAGCDPEPGMVELAAETGAGYILMQMPGTPQTMESCAGTVGEAAIVDAVQTALERGVARLLAAGVTPEQVALDVGLGFGKSPAESLQLLAATAHFATLGYPLVVGASRKRFLGHDDPNLRVGASLGAALWAAQAGAAIVRVHDVWETAEALRLYRAAQQRSEGLTKCSR